MDSLKIDVCLTAFSCSAAAPCNQWARDYFADVPRIVWVPGASSSQFEQVGSGVARDVVGWAAARAKCRREDVHRVAVVTFSAGWGFVHRLLHSPEARARIDAVLLLDGLHTRDLAGEKAYAERAALGGPFLVMAHSQIRPPFVSARDTNTEVMQAALATGVQGCNVAPEYVASAVLDAPVTLGNQYGRRTFDADPLAGVHNVGSAWRLEYEGDNAAIHMYIAQRVQPRLWRWLAERWANKSRGVVLSPA